MRKPNHTFLAGGLAVMLCLGGVSGCVKNNQVMDKSTEPSHTVETENLTISSKHIDKMAILQNKPRQSRNEKRSKSFAPRSPEELYGTFSNDDN